MGKILSLPIVKRKTICVLLGIAFGFLCAYLAYSGMEAEAQVVFWGSALMWSMVYNRFLIGVMVLIFGVFTEHPVFPFRIWPWLRGAIAGFIVSIDIGTGGFIAGLPEATMIFWMTVLAGVFYGVVIDVVATKFAGEGKDLLKKTY